MMLTKMTRFGTRAVFDMAYNSSGLPVQVKHIVKRQNLPLKFLEQIFNKLKKADFIKSQRGKHGGYVLTKDPREITVGDIVRAVDEPLDLVCCVSDTKTCNRAGQCPTRPVWEETSRMVQEYLDTVTIADLCEDACQKGLKQELNHKN